MAPGTSHATLMVRTYAALLQAAEDLGRSTTRCATPTGRSRLLQQPARPRRRLHPVIDDVRDRIKVVADAATDEARATPGSPGADLPQEVQRDPAASSRPCRRRIPSPLSPGHRAGDEHDLRRRRRRPARPDGRHGPAADDVRVHPGHEPRRTPYPGPGRHAVQRGTLPGPLPLRELHRLPPRALPTGRGDRGDAVRSAGTGPWPARSPRRSSPVISSPALSRTTSRSTSPSGRGHISRIVTPDHPGRVRAVAPDCGGRCREALETLIEHWRAVDDGDVTKYAGWQIRRQDALMVPAGARADGRVRGEP